MKIVHIEWQKIVWKTKEELQQEKNECSTELQRICVPPYKKVKRKEPIYIVELSAKELQLISFYLELENRKPIVNVELDTKLKKENKK